MFRGSDTGGRVQGIGRNWGFVIIISARIPCHWEVDGQAASARPSGKQCFITSPGRAEATIPVPKVKSSHVPIVSIVVPFFSLTNI